MSVLLPVSSASQQDTEANILNEIAIADSAEKLQLIVPKYGNRINLWQAHANRQSVLLSQANQSLNQLKGRVSTLLAPDGSELNDLVLSQKVIQQLPPNTYLEVRVTTLAQYQFAMKLTKARKIELIRIDWGWLNVPISNSIQAFVSSSCIKDSMYRQAINSNLIMAGVLASSLVTNNTNVKQDFEKQITMAYWSGKSIEIIVPFDFSEDGVVTIESASGLLAFSINAGRWLRSLFTRQ